MEAPVTNSSTRFLTFRVAAQLYALNCEDVSEVMRVPSVARIPQGPAALLGVANLRGSVLPIASVRELLGQPVATDSPGARAIVLDIGAPVAIVVDSVEALETVATGQIDTHKKELSEDGVEKLLGAFSIQRDGSVAKILDIKALLESAFANRARTQPTRNIAASVGAASVTRSSKPSEMLVTFEVAGQEFALPLEAVEEILQAPTTMTAAARSEAAVLGMVSVRDSLLPLLSLRSLLGFAAAQAPDDREKVVVMKVAGTHVGLVADRARAVVVADTDLVDPIPPVIAARTGGESRIRSIYRGEGGRRLISILSPEQLFREDVMQRLIAGHDSQESQASPAESGNRSQLTFLVFRLGNEEFGLPIDAIVEVAQVPSQIARVPKAPRFLEGVVNMRGEVLPVVDQRRRFDMPVLESTETRRLVVIRTARHRAGLIVDSVSDVLRTFADSIEPPPDLTDDMTRLVQGVINLEKSNRIVLLLDPTEVLTRAELKLLDSFQAASKKANV